MITDDGKSIDAVRGGYHWNFGTIGPKYVVADSSHPYEFKYSDENTIAVSREDALHISNSNKLSKCY
jgi:hypothetical protein